MATTYTETPENIGVLEDAIITELSEIKATFFTTKKVLFYDACSFQRHANLADAEQQIAGHADQAGQVAVGGADGGVAGVVRVPDKQTDQ